MRRAVASALSGLTALVMGATVMTGAACEETTDPPLRDAQAPDVSNEVPDATSTGVSFDPAQFPTECEQDSDCVLVSAITECTTCCPTSAVNREPGEQRYSNVVGACGGELTKCKRVCDPLIAHCDEKRCVAR